MTAFEEFKKMASKMPTNDFLHIPLQAAKSYSSESIDYCYDEALEEIIELSELYCAAGYGPGQRIALVLENRAEFFLHFQALNKLGISAVPVYSGGLWEEMTYIFEHCDCCLVVSLPEHMANTKKALSAIDKEIRLVESNAMNVLPASQEKVNNASPDGDTEAIMIYTSGTTGEAKGCMINNDYLISMGQWYVDITGYCHLEYGKERMLTPLPLIHMNALCTMMAMIMSGGCIIQLDRFHPSSWWEIVRQSKATCLHYLGVIPAILLNQTEQEDDNIGEQIKFGFGAGVDPKHLQRFEERFGFKLVEGWAMTETGTHICITTHEEPRHIGTRCVGKALNPIEYRLIDEEGNDVKAGEPGELLIRAAGDNPRFGFFTGYYKNEEETEKVWEGGYFHTGDVLSVSEDGSFHFVDRRKNIIRRSGVNIAAVEVENVLFHIPEIKNCAVTPVYDEMRGEEVGVCVVLVEDTEKGEEIAKQIFNLCNEKLAYHKTPGYYMFVSELPMTSSQKIQRSEVKKLALELVEQGDCFDFRDLKRKHK